MRKTLCALAVLAGLVACSTQQVKETTDFQPWDVKKEVITQDDGKKKIIYYNTNGDLVPMKRDYFKIDGKYWEIYSEDENHDGKIEIIFEEL